MSWAGSRAMREPAGVGAGGAAGDAAGSAAPTLSARQPRAIHSALTVLEAVAALGAGVTAREISLALGLPRATAYRLLNLLVQDEYLVRTPDLAGFALGAKVIHLAAAAAPVRIPRAARDIVEETRRRVRGGVHLVVYTEGRIVVADADPDFPLSDEQRLAREPERFALGLLRDVDARPSSAPDAAADLRAYGVVRRAGATSGCLAAPIRDASGALAGALAYSGPRRRVDDPAETAAVLVAAARELSPLIT